MNPKGSCASTQPIQFNIIAIGAHESISAPQIYYSRLSQLGISTKLARVPIHAFFTGGLRRFYDFLL
jgi:hypothetical protein